jgi:crotonobetainyl-CoA:carnitine CoA-transferase CaiB-like acyl-CoA transferase
MGIDFAMADLIASHFNEFLAAASLDSDSDRFVDRANELSPYAPNGVYPTIDGWIALSVRDDEQFGALAGVLAHELAADPGFHDATARFEARRELDRRIRDATHSRSAAELAAKLRAAGVPAEVMASAADLRSSALLAARGFFCEVEHPVWGRRSLVGIPWRVYGQSPPPLGTPPQLALPSAP